MSQVDELFPEGRHDAGYHTINVNDKNTPESAYHETNSSNDMFVGDNEIVNSYDKGMSFDFVSDLRLMQAISNAYRAGYSDAVLQNRNDVVTAYSDGVSDGYDIATDYVMAAGCDAFSAGNDDSAHVLRVMANELEEVKNNG